MSILRLENLSKYYTSAASVVMGLTKVNLSFEVGEFVAVTGESGSGKSTLAHVLGGIIPYESGELYINGAATSHYDAADWEYYRCDLVSFISQSYGILPGNTVLENIVSTLMLGGMEASAADEAARKILSEVELSGLESRKAGKLSSGQKQRLSIARALAKPSKILIADEPTGNLDRENSEKVAKLLKKVSSERLVIMITHDFDEVKSLATRHIVLSDGVVVTDTPLENEKAPKMELRERDAARRKKQERLAPYVSYLTVKSRPIFSALCALLLVITTLVTFIFLGAFTVALDDTTTKIYDSSVFPNGNSRRLIVMRRDGEAFTEEDYGKILEVSRVRDIERMGYLNDVSYYYKSGVDYIYKPTPVYGENYHPIINPDDYYITNKVDFIGTGLYMRTVPETSSSFLTRGKLPEEVYQVVSADRNYKIGDEVTVYLRDNVNWNRSAYIKMTLTVVGETLYGEGLYFSDGLGALINNQAYEFANSKGASSIHIYAPYKEGVFGLTSYIDKYGKTVENKDVSPEVDFEIGEDGFIPTELVAKEGIKLNSQLKPNIYGSYYKIYCRAYNDSTYQRFTLVSEELWNSLAINKTSNQISVYIDDYAYTDRVTEKLEDMGYITASPYRLGATETDPDLATERYLTLGICLGALVLIFVLQTLLLRAMFSSLTMHFGLMSNIGLISKTAFLSVGLIISVFAVLGEALGAIIILILNSVGIPRITSIFKYLTEDVLILLFVIHLLSALVSIPIVIKNMKKTIFANKSLQTDLVFHFGEEAASND